MAKRKFLDKSQKSKKGNRKNDQTAMLGSVKVRRKGKNRQMVVNIGTIFVVMAPPGMGAEEGDPILMAIREKIKNDKGRCGPGCTCTTPLGTFAPPGMPGGCQPAPGTEPKPGEPDASGGGAEAEAQPPVPASVPAQPNADEERAEGAEERHSEE